MNFYMRRGGIAQLVSWLGYGLDDRRFRGWFSLGTRNFSLLYNLHTHSVGCARCRENNFLPLAGIRRRAVPNILTTLVRILLRRNIRIFWAGEFGRGISDEEVRRGIGRHRVAGGVSMHQVRILTWPTQVPQWTRRWCICTVKVETAGPSGMSVPLYQAVGLYSLEHSNNLTCFVSNSLIDLIIM